HCAKSNEWKRDKRKSCRATTAISTRIESPPSKPKIPLATGFLSGKSIQIDSRIGTRVNAKYAAVKITTGGNSHLRFFVRPASPSIAAGGNNPPSKISMGKNKWRFSCQENVCSPVANPKCDSPYFRRISASQLTKISAATTQASIPKRTRTRNVGRCCFCPIGAIHAAARNNGGSKSPVYFVCAAKPATSPDASANMTERRSSPCKNSTSAVTLRL